MSPTANMKRKHSEISDASASVLHSLEGGLNDIRELVTCRICVHPMFEPFTTDCGHTFCYSCLSKWFEQNRTKKSCPDCRSKVKGQPAPAYVVRDIVQVLATRQELLGPGETLTEHTKWQKDEKTKVEADKASPHGLFQGLFRQLHPLRHIYDSEDGVRRCPNCAWELEGGECGSCGYQPASSDESDSGSDSDETVTTRSSQTVGLVPNGIPDHLDLDSLDPNEVEAMFGPQFVHQDWDNSLDGHEIFAEESVIGEHYDDAGSFFGDEADDEDDESGGSINDFIVNDEVDETALTHENLHRHNEVPISDSEDNEVPPFSSDDESSNPNHTFQLTREQYSLSPSNALGDQSDSEPISYSRHFNPRRHERPNAPQVRVPHRPRSGEQRLLVISSESDSDEPIISHSRPRVRPRRHNTSQQDGHQETRMHLSSNSPPLESTRTSTQGVNNAAWSHDDDQGRQPRNRDHGSSTAATQASNSLRPSFNPQPSRLREETSLQSLDDDEDSNLRGHGNRHKRHRGPHNVSENAPRISVVV